MKRTTLLVLLIFAYIQSTFAAAFTASLSGNPINTTGWTYNVGVSYVSGNTFVLTPPTNTQAGYIYYSTPVNLTGCAQFTVTFDFQITNSTAPPADGLTFFYITNPPSGFVTGGGLGLPTNPNGLALLLDTYDNDGNTNNPLVSLRNFNGTYNYTEGNPTGQIVPDVTYQNFITNTQWHTCVLQYNNGNITVAFDGNAPIMTGYSLLNMTGYFGFSASTGALHSQHTIRNVSIVVTPPPAPTVVTPVTYCQFATDTPLTATGTNLQWYTTATGGTALPTAPTPGTSLPGSSIWYVSQIPAGFSCESDRTAITVNVIAQPNPPDISATPSTYCQGQTFVPFTVTGQNILWYPTPTGGTGSATAPTVNTTVPGTYTYYATQTVNGCESNRASVTVVVNPGVTSAFNYTFLHGCTQDTLIFFNNSTGNIDSSWWSFGDATTLNLNGASAMTSPPLHFYPSPGTYTIKLGVSNGLCRDTSTQVLTLTHVLPVASFNMSADTICKGQSLTVTSTSTGGGLSYAWNYGDGLNGVGSPSTHTYNVAGTLTTKLIITDSIGCKDSTSKNIVIGQVPTVNAGPDVTTCINNSIQLNATYGPPGPTYSILWTPNQYINDPTIANPTVSPTTTIDYVINVTDNSSGNHCVGRDTVRVNVLTGYTLYNHDTSICFGKNVQILLTGDPRYSYLWSPGTGVSSTTIVNPIITPDTTTTYTIDASYPGCRDSITRITIKVEPIPQVNIGPDRIICQGDTVHIHATAGPQWFSPYHYQWSPTGALSFSNPDTTDVAFIGITDSTISVITTTPAGCSGTDTMHISVIPTNFAQLITPTSDVSICPNTEVPIQIGGSGVIYHWVPSLYLSDSTISNPVSHPITNTAYTVYITDIHGCRDTLQVKISIHPEAVLSLPDSVSIYPGETAILEPAGNCLYYTWTPPIGLSSTSISNPIANPDISTQYIVRGSTENGCVASDSILVIVHPETVIGIPNVFTPGTGPNSKLLISKRGIAVVKSFSIFNRWGNKVFETADINEGWNGDFKGEPQPMGVYIYMLDEFTNSGKHITQQGNITLIR